MTTENENTNDQNTQIDLENLLEEDIIEAEKAEAAIEDDLKEFSKVNDELTNLKDALARAQADYQNLIRRVERDKEDMWTYLTWNIISKFLPMIDNMDRIISMTPEAERNTSIFEWVKSIRAWITKTLEWFGVRAFDSIWNEVDANLHDVMTQLPWEEWKIIQEFEKGYMIWDKVLRHAKVVVWSWE